MEHCEGGGVRMGREGGGRGGVGHGGELAGCCGNNGVVNGSYLGG